MSILIKGMEMPKYFQQAEVGLDADGNGVLLVYPEGGNEPNVYSIVPVPSHGRLIDADALLQGCERIQGKYATREYAFSQSAIENAPTIIPAEEGET